MHRPSAMAIYGLDRLERGLFLGVALAQILALVHPRLREGLAVPGWPVEMMAFLSQCL